MGAVEIVFIIIVIIITIINIINIILLQHFTQFVTFAHSLNSLQHQFKPTLAVYKPYETRLIDRASQHCKSPLVEAASEEKKTVKLTGLNLVVEAVSVQFVGRCYKEE